MTARPLATAPCQAEMSPVTAPRSPTPATRPLATLVDTAVLGEAEMPTVTAPRSPTPATRPLATAVLYKAEMPKVTGHPARHVARERAAAGGVANVRLVACDARLEPWAGPRRCRSDRSVRQPRRA